MTSTSAIETSSLRKEYGTKVAVADLTVRVERGEIFGFLGPNGAGKTTSIKMLLGLTAPTSGTARILGCPFTDRSIQRKIGFLPEHFRFYDWLTARELLIYHGRLLGMGQDECERQAPALLDLVGLSRYSDARLRTFSKGMLQRIGLAQALLNEPELVFLDEPTSGLDPLGRRLVRDIIRDLRSQGTTVFLNSHLLSEVEITCDRVAFIKEGVVVRTAELQRLVEGQTTVEMRVGGVTPTLLEGLKQWGTEIRADGAHVHLVVDDEEVLPAIAAWVIEQGARLYTLEPKRLSLEDLFLEIVGTTGEPG
ncbi:MAG: ABC transporter ATP-binding protein [Chloroflexi bacterium]|nr:ABC transporter ATP-binding protein [Chloroflexota bacterium]